MKKLLLLVLACCTLWTGCESESQQEEATIRYDVRFPNAEHHEADVTLTLENLTPGLTTISMSRTSPGRYALHEFAKNVYEVSAVNEEGDTLNITRPDLHNWTVEGHEGTIIFNYTLFADHADGTYAGINEQHAHLNMPAAFAWVQTLSDTPVTVQFHPPEGADWQVATQLEPADLPYTFTAPDYYYFLDSPTELSDFMTAKWAAPSDTTQQTIKLAVHHNGTQQQVNDYAGMARKVVEEQVAVFGRPVDFDYDEYVFIADYLPYVYGDGMEHRNSTILTSQRTLEEEDALRNLYTLSHEFFHTWNVERLRPASLEPFNFMQANVSGALWFAEGFTSYYDDLTIRRAGIISDQAYVQDLSGTLNSVLNAPGNKYYSPIEMSMQAPFVDAATSVDAQNKSNTFISYYSWGAVIGLGLDLTLRSEFEGVTLDDYMRRAWETYGRTEEPYEMEDLQQTLAELTDSTFADQFFTRHIRGGRQVDLRPLLDKAGMLLQKANPGSAVLQFGRNKIDFEDNVAVVSRYAQVGSPLYEAGIDHGDRIRSVAGRSITNARDLQQVLAAHAPGEEVEVVFSTLGEERTATVSLAEDPTLELVLYEEAGRQLTDEMRQFRQDWLGSKATARK